MADAKIHPDDQEEYDELRAKLDKLKKKKKEAEEKAAQRQVDTSQLPDLVPYSNKIKTIQELMLKTLEARVAFDMPLERGVARDENGLTRGEFILRAFREWQPVDNVKEEDGDQLMKEDLGKNGNVKSKKKLEKKSSEPEKED